MLLFTENGFSPESPADIQTAISTGYDFGIDITQLAGEVWAEFDLCAGHGGAELARSLATVLVLHHDQRLDDHGFLSACCQINKYADPIEGERSGLTDDEAAEIAAEDARLLWIEVAS